MIKNRNDTKQCPGCNGPAGRDVETELQSTSQEVTDHPRWSWSMGCTPEDAKAILQKHPDLESDFRHGKEGGPLLVKNRQDKKRKMSIFGMHEY
jgi:hypothetical protein